MRASVPVTTPNHHPRWTWPARLFVAALLLLTFGLLIHPVGDPDLYIHLRDGRYWVENHFHVDKEPFGYTIPDKPLERVEVLFRAGAYLLHQLGGYSLLIVCKAIAMTVALFFLGLLVYRRWPNLGFVGLLMGLAVLVPATRIMPVRPYVVTYLMLPIILWWLDIWRESPPESKRAAKRLWLIPPLTVLWANCHPGFVVLFGFLGAQWLDDLISFWRSRQPLHAARLRHLMWVSIAAFLAGALNPIGFDIYRFVFETTQSADFMKFLTEWAPPRLSQEPLFFFFLIGVWLSQLATVRRLRFYDIVPLAAFSYLALKSYRNIPLMLIAALPPLASSLHHLVARFIPPSTTRYRSHALISGSLATVILTVWATVSGYAFRMGEIPHMYPKNGLEWLSRHPIPGRLLTHDIWGGYTGWMTHGRIQVFIDGRFPSFGQKIYSDYRKIIWGDPSQCLSLLDLYHIQGLLISPKNDIKLVHELWKSRQWGLVYWDDDCLLYVRRSAENESLLKFFQYYAIDPKKTPYYNPARPALALQEAKRAAEITPTAFLPRFFMGELYLKLNDPQGATQAFADVLKIEPDHIGALHNLGVLTLKNNQPEKAEALLRKAWRLTPKTQASLRARCAYALAETIQKDSKRKKEALRWANQSLKAQPGWEQAVQLINQLSSPGQDSGH